jgi:hypothetical protein
VLDLDSTSTVILVERYVLAVLYFATSAEGGSTALSFFTAKSVCEWKGVVCNEDDLVVALLPGKSKHGEVIILISKFGLTHLFIFHSDSVGWGIGTGLKGSIPSELGELTALTVLTIRTWIGLSRSYECHACSHFLYQIGLDFWVQFRANSEN